MEAARLLMEVMRDQAPLSGDSPGSVLRGRVERMLRGMHILTFGGGTNEMQRDLIAIFGLNMPGSPLEPQEHSKMDFSLTEEQEELRGLAARILEDRMGLQHLKARDRSEDWYDADTWRGVREANLLESRDRKRRAVSASAFSTCVSYCARSAETSRRSRR